MTTRSEKSSALRIQIVLPFTSLTGGNMVLVELANQLARRGHDVWMIYEHPDIPWTKPRGFLKTRLRDAGLLPWFRWHKAEVPIVRCHRFDADYVPDADVIIASYWRHIPQLASLPANKGRKVYYVQAYETDFVEDASIKSQIDATYRSPMTYVVVADWIGEILKKKFHQPSVKIPPPLSDHILQKSTLDRAPFSGRCLMQHHIPLAKGVLEGIQAFEAARSVSPALSLSLFGPHSLDQTGPYYKLGQIPTWKMPAIYDTHDLFIWPSLREGFGLPPLEAMARGVPVVTSDNGGSREFAIHEETALVSPPGDLKSMSQNLLRLVSEPDLRQKLARNGQELARSRFTWDNTCSAFEAIIRSQLSQKKNSSH